VAEVPDGPAHHDPVAVVAASRQAPRVASRLPSLLAEGLGLAYRAGRGTLLVGATGQLLGAVFAGLQVLVATYALREVLATERTGKDLSSALAPLILLAGISALTTATSTLMAQRQRLLGELVSRYVWKRVMAVATRVPLETFESPQFFDRLQRLQTHATVYPLTLSTAVVTLLGGIAGLAVLGVALLRIAPVLVPLLAVAGLPLLVLNRRGSALEFRFAVRETPGLRRRDYLRRVLTGRDEAKEVRAYDLATPLGAQHDVLAGDYVSRLRKHLRRRTELQLLGAAATTVVMAGTLLLLVHLVDEGEVSVAEAGGAVIAIRLSASRLAQVTNGVGSLFESALFLAELSDFLRLAPPPDDRDGSAAPPFARLRGEGLTFTYPGSAQPAVVDVDIDLRPGEVVALVGENGSGKSTLSKLLAGLYVPTGGRLLWDERPAEELPAAARREQVAVLFQDFVRYQLSALQNVALGRGGRPAEPDDVRRAATDADVDALLADLPEGYDTVLSREFAGGREISGGQWQRVALARAFFRGAPFLVLDEPSAALDPRAEHALFQRLRTLFEGRTVLFVSHRFSTVRSADRIYVMHEGRVVEAGSHAELMARHGLYAELFSLQADAYLET
jgi:ATP-binding cassette subfamily B protein